MPNLAIAFILLALGMYISVQVIDSIIARFNLFPNRSKTNNPDSSGIDLPSDYNLGIDRSARVASNCDLEAVCTQVAEKTSITEGVITIAESAVDGIANAIEGL